MPLPGSPRLMPCREARCRAERFRQQPARSRPHAAYATRHRRPPRARRRRRARYSPPGTRRLTATATVRPCPGRTSRRAAAPASVRRTRRRTTATASIVLQLAHSLRGPPTAPRQAPGSRRPARRPRRCKLAPSPQALGPASSPSSASAEGTVSTVPGDVARGAGSGAGGLRGPAARCARRRLALLPAGPGAPYHLLSGRPSGGSPSASRASRAAGAQQRREVRVDPQRLLRCGGGPRRTARAPARSCPGGTRTARCRGALFRRLLRVLQRLLCSPARCSAQPSASATPAPAAAATPPAAAAPPPSGRRGPPRTGPAPVPRRPRRPAARRHPVPQQVVLHPRRLRSPSDSYNSPSSRAYSGSGCSVEGRPVGVQGLRRSGPAPPAPGPPGQRGLLVRVAAQRLLEVAAAPPPVAPLPGQLARPVQIRRPLGAGPRARAAASASSPPRPRASRGPGRPAAARAITARPGAQLLQPLQRLARRLVVAEPGVRVDQQPDTPSTAAAPASAPPRPTSCAARKSRRAFASAASPASASTLPARGPHPQRRPQRLLGLRVVRRSAVRRPCST